ncbi:hypothetical protein P7L78_26265 [Tistrella bauzanensis]|uniref:hypothetical protein n=1 Tax=Tistrella TaxID=171436 RepID=UPI0031F6B764
MPDLPDARGAVIPDPDGGAAGIGMSGVEAGVSTLLDTIYRSHLRQAARDAGGEDAGGQWAGGRALDRLHRRPERLLDLARRHDLIPDPGRVILVTGSKGKGSTARLIAAGQTAAGRRTLLFTSPEDMTPLDRIRIDGTVIAPADAVGAFQMLAAGLRAVEASLPAGEALSPFGQFLLLALVHARRSAVDRLVLETGLGAADDEAGRLAAAIGVVTAILPEHLDRLGPGIDDVARAKLDIRHRCQRLILSDQADRAGRRAGIDTGGARVVAPPVTMPGHAGHPPPWLAHNRAMALAALAGDGIDPAAPVVVAALDDAARGLPSWGEAPWAGGIVAWEAAVQAASLDVPRLRWLAARGFRALLSVTDDKDVAGLATNLAEAGLAPRGVVLAGRRGALRAGAGAHRRLLALSQADGPLKAPALGPLDHDDVPAMARLLYDGAGMDDQRPVAGGKVIAIGTQSFVRLVRAAIRSGR